MIFDIVLAIGVVVAAIFSVLLRALKVNGAVAAIAVGVTIILGTHFRGLLLLGIFFVTSNLSSKYRHDEKIALKDMVEKGDVRDYAQVLANGGVAALFSLIFAVTGEEAALFAYCVSLASANADTWASEIGVLSHKDPVSLFTGKRVAKGTSGAVSVLGTLAGLGGSALIATSSFLFWSNTFHPYSLLGITVWGFFNMLLDSVFGFLLQEKRLCYRCGKITEKGVHCGTVTSYKKGIPGFNNDWVNFTSILITSILSYFFYKFLS